MADFLVDVFLKVSSKKFYFVHFEYLNPSQGSTGRQEKG